MSHSMLILFNNHHNFYIYVNNSFYLIMDISQVFQNDLPQSMSLIYLLWGNKWMRRFTQKRLVSSLLCIWTHWNLKWIKWSKTLKFLSIWRIDSSQFVCFTSLCSTQRGTGIDKEGQLVKKKMEKALCDMFYNL